VLIVLTLVMVGAALLLLETILPGLIAGILGMCCLIGAVVTGYLSFGAQTGNLVLLGVVVGLIVGTSIWLKYFPDSRMARAFISRRIVGDLKTDKPELLEQTGIAQTNLRPSGTALINGQRVDVVTEGALIEKGAPIKVVAVEGLRVVVRAT
jgi:membrane-bound ClpP family serine protease